MSDDRNSDDLDRRIADAKAEHSRGISNAEGRAESRGWALGIEFIGMVLIAGFLGWLFDQWAGTGPWAMIVLLLVGFAGGVLRAMKASAQFDADPTTGNRE